MGVRSVVVAGGGLAGITAALQLADAGRAVTLVEGRPRLGGAAFSFTRGDLTIDNGQHVFLRCCEEYLALLGRLGVRDKIRMQRHLDVPVLHPDGRVAHLARTKGLPAPGHLTASLLRYNLLKPADRLRIVRGALALRRLDLDDPSLDQQTLGGFLRRHGQNDATIARMWAIIAVATLNVDPDQASLALAAKVFKTGLLEHAPAADIGYAAVPLGALHSDAAHDALTRAGVDVLLAHKVSRVESRADDSSEMASVVVTSRTSERTLLADDVVLALPWSDCLASTPQLAQTSSVRAEALGSSPIVNIHVIYDRKVTDLAFGAAVDSPVQWFFDRTDTSGLATGQYLAVTVSAADSVIDRPSRELSEEFERELARLLPRARGARVVDAFVTRERRATFRQVAGSAAARPSSDSGLDRIWLAGAWTATGWPDTMESAVRSGNAAARCVLDTAGKRGQVLAA
ncbi:MAG: phytoene dehydrogenase [Pseudonocardiales bacterium]|nr:phytoene dehydrogenase [Pseudonocardiales bacterium]